MLWRQSRPARAKRSPPSGFIVPCAPTLVYRPPSGPLWVHEVKLDGYRIIARRTPAGVRLWTRNAIDMADRFERIAASLADLPVKSVLLDGEAVVMRPDGSQDFEALRTKAGAAGAAYFAFDVLELD